MWNFIIPAAASLGTTLIGAGMQGGNSMNMQQYMKFLSEQMGQVPGLANLYFNNMMSSPIGINMQNNAMNMSRATQQSLAGSQAGRGGFNTGVGAMGRALGNSVYFNNLSKGQSGLYGMAWNSANQNLMNLLQMATQYGSQNDMMRAGMRNRVMGAGLGGLANAFSMMPFMSGQNPMNMGRAMEIGQTLMPWAR